MSKIATYGLADSPLQLSDRLIGTEAPRPQPSVTPLATKNFSLGELLQLFSSNFPAASLQAVLNTGNTATQNITLTGTITSSVIKPEEIEDALGSQGSEFQFLSKAASGINWVDLPTIYPTLDEVLNAGDTSSLTPKVGGISLFDGVGYVNIEGNNNQFYFSNRSNFTFAQIYQDNILLKDLNGYSFKIQKPSNISNNHTAFLQDTSGTIAYLGDIPTPISLTTLGSSGPATLIGSVLNIPIYSGGSSTVPTLDEVLTEGNISTKDASIGGLSLYDSSNLYYYGIYADDDMFRFVNNDGNFVALLGLAEFTLYKTSTIAANLSASLLTSTRNFQLPNDSGTIALTSNIPSLIGYVPYTGATQNVDLGEYELKAGQLTLDISPTGTASVGTTQWNNTIGSSQTLLKGGNVFLKNGVDLVARVVNKVTPNATLLRSDYQAVRISGAQGQRLAVAYAQANNDNNSADTIGLVCENISTNQEGFIITVGQLEEINTTGSLQGETWSDGDVLYLSPTTAGKLTNIKPTGLTGHIVVIGYVEYAHAIHGSIYVKIMNGWELDELHNVYISSPVNNEVLAYNSSNQLWENKTIEEVTGTYNVKVTIPSSIVTGTVSEVQLLKLEIPPYSFAADDVLNIPSLIISKVGTAALYVLRVKLSSSSTMPVGTGTETIAFMSIGNTQIFTKMYRNFFINGGFVKGYPLLNTASDVTNSTTALREQAFDNTITNYLYVSISPSSAADAFQLIGLQINNI